MPVDYINLAHDSMTSTPFRASGIFSIAVIPGAKGWGSSVVEIQWSNDFENADGDNTGDNWHSFNPAMILGGSRTSHDRILTPGGGHVRLKTTTGDGAADPAAEIVYGVGALEDGRVNRKILGQSRPANTTAASLYSPAAGVRAEIWGITVANTTGTDATFRLFLDTDGSTYDQSTAIYYDMNVEANTTFPIEPELPWVLDNTSGNLGIRSGTASALTYTVWGVES